MKNATAPLPRSEWTASTSERSTDRSGEPWQLLGLASALLDRMLAKRSSKNGETSAPARMQNSIGSSKRRSTPTQALRTTVPTDGALTSTD